MDVLHIDKNAFAKLKKNRVPTRTVRDCTKFSLHTLYSIIKNLAIIFQIIFKTYLFYKKISKF